jgi:hypothetical protein
MIDKVYGSRLNPNKSYDFKSSLKSSRSNPNILMNQSEIIAAEERDLESEKMDESIKAEEKPQPPEMKSMKHRKKSTDPKGKGMMDNSAWLE